MRGGIVMMRVRVNGEGLEMIEKKGKDSYSSRFIRH